ncbi:MAG: CHAT domain-containing protein [Nitrospira sp.]
MRLGAKEQALAVFDVEKLQQMLSLGEVKEYGAELTASFFKDASLRAAFAQARAAAGQTDASLRVRLAIGSNALELHALRWELLNDPQNGGMLATDQSIFFSRYLSSADWRAVRLRARGELKALALIAAPNGLEAHKLAHVDKAVETTTIAQGLGQLHLQILEHGTLNDIVSALTSQEFDILYLVAHGQFGGDREGRLWLEDAQGEIDHVTVAAFANRLRELENRPRLVVLASCQSAGTGTGEILAALGYAVGRGGHSGGGGDAGQHHHGDSQAVYAGFLWRVAKGRSHRPCLERGAWIGA